jgi:folate-dependent phosphoribosylglycinamide formyltransferase PurN
MSLSNEVNQPRTVHLRHKENIFDRDVIGRWLASETDLTAELIIEPDRQRKLSTLWNEAQRSGITGLIDALAFRAYYHTRLAEKERSKIDNLVEERREQYRGHQAPIHTIEDPNSSRTISLLKDFDADIMIARCQVLLDEQVFTQPTHGTFVIHPGVCPEYRNQHGCFWALANGDDEKVGYSLLRIDEGVDTGNIYAQNGAIFNPQVDEHVYLQLKMVADNLNEIGDTLRSVHRGEATPVDTTGRPSAVWGMPKLSAWLTWKRRVRKFDITHVDSSPE